MIQPGERFEVNGITLEAVATTKENSCIGCTFFSEQGCEDPMHDHDCFDLTTDTYVIFKEITNE